MLAAVLATHLLSQAPYVPGRYDMGVRLQLVDQAWIAASPELKKAAAPQLSNAVTAFFSGKPQDACKALDEARAVLTKQQPAASWGLSYRPEKPVFEGEEKVSFIGQRVYGNATPSTVAFDGPPKTNEYGVAPISMKLPNGQTVHAVWTKDWPSLKNRLSSLRDTSAKALATRIFAKIDRPETWSHAPALSDWISTAFRLESGEMAKIREIPMVQHQATEFRIAFPAKTEADTDVMIALHGAGGEADMFFESYGAGIWRKRANDAGMIFASPTTTAKAPAAVLDWLKTVRKISPKRVILVGHSMGGGAVISAASALEPKPHAMILLAPAAGALPPSIKAVPTFVAIGENELMMIRGMAGRLKEASEATPSGRYLTVPHAEHLMVVADSVDIAFDWLKKLP